MTGEGFSHPEVSLLVLQPVADRGAGLGVPGLLCVLTPAGEQVGGQPPRPSRPHLPPATARWRAPLGFPGPPGAGAAAQRAFTFDTVLRNSNSDVRKCPVTCLLKSLDFEFLHVCLFCCTALKFKNTPKLNETVEMSRLLHARGGTPRRLRSRGARPLDLRSRERFFPGQLDPK